MFASGEVICLAEPKKPVYYSGVYVVASLNQPQVIFGTKKQGRGKKINRKLNITVSAKLHIP